MTTEFGPLPPVVGIGSTRCTGFGGGTGMDRRYLETINWKLRATVAPGLTYSQDRYESTLNANCMTNLRWLDLGCGHQILPSWRKKQEESLLAEAGLVVGIDYDFYSLRSTKL